MKHLSWLWLLVVLCVTPLAAEEPPTMTLPSLPSQQAEERSSRCYPLATSEYLLTADKLNALYAVCEGVQPADVCLAKVRQWLDAFIQ